MKITFIKDCPAIYASGWSAYKKGDKADFSKGARLVTDGYAREGWEEPKPEPPKPAPKKRTRRTRKKVTK